MEALKFKHYITILLIVLTITSCTQGDDKMKIIPYGTEEFQEFTKDAPISLDEAWKIQLNFMKKNTTDDLGYRLYKNNVGMFFIVDNYYVFSIGHLNNKMLEGYFLSGVWVDTKTGEVFEKDIRKKIKPLKAWSKN
ncbi:MAG: hypothetical protein GY932_14460 [Arcobacter sp.]|nr:hypothetical protein [Arcobacter sp.]